VLQALADDVIIPGYAALVAALDQLGTDLDALCVAPSLAKEASSGVHDDCVDGYRDIFIDGMDGDPQSASTSS
jgi:predicted lipoprotein